MITVSSQSSPEAATRVVATTTTISPSSSPPSIKVLSKSLHHPQPQVQPQQLCAFQLEEGQYTSTISAYCPPTPMLLRTSPHELFNVNAFRLAKSPPKPSLISYSKDRQVILNKFLLNTTTTTATSTKSDKKSPLKMNLKAISKTPLLPSNIASTTSNTPEFRIVDRSNRKKDPRLLPDSILQKRFEQIHTTEQHPIPQDSSRKQPSPTIHNQLKQQLSTRSSAITTTETSDESSSTAIGIEFQKKHAQLGSNYYFLPSFSASNSPAGPSPSASPLRQMTISSRQQATMTAATATSSNNSSLCCGTSNHFRETLNDFKVKVKRNNEQIISKTARSFNNHPVLSENVSSNEGDSIENNIMNSSHYSNNNNNNAQQRYFDNAFQPHHRRTISTGFESKFMMEWEGIQKQQQLYQQSLQVSPRLQSSDTKIIKHRKLIPPMTAATTTNLNLSPHPLIATATPPGTATTTENLHWQYPSFLLTDLLVENKQYRSQSCEQQQLSKTTTTTTTTTYANGEMLDSTYYFDSPGYNNTLKDADYMKRTQFGIHMTCLSRNQQNEEESPLQSRQKNPVPNSANYSGKRNTGFNFTTNTNWKADRNQEKIDVVAEQRERAANKIGKNKQIDYLNTPQPVFRIFSEDLNKRIHKIYSNEAAHRYELEKGILMKKNLRKQSSFEVPEPNQLMRERLSKIQTKSE